MKKCEPGCACGKHDKKSRCPPGCECWKDLPYGEDRRRSYVRHWSLANKDKRLAYLRRYRQRNPDAQRKAFLKHKHGLTLEEWQDLRVSQGGLCYLCEEPLGDSSGVSVDHDHSCCPPGKSCARCRRGLAHNSCNILISMIGEDTVRLETMVTNLRAAQRRYPGQL